MHKKAGNCMVHGSSFERVHGRIDSLAVDMTKVNITLFGDPSKNVEGILQQSARWQERMNLWMKVFTFVGSTLSAGIIAILIKEFMAK